MPHKLRQLPGSEVVSIFEKLGFVFHSQSGSHIKLRRFSQQGEKQTLTIVAYNDIDKGTLQAIYRHAAKRIYLQFPFRMLTSIYFITNQNNEIIQLWSLFPDYTFNMSFGCK